MGCARSADENDVSKEGGGVLSKNDELRRLDTSFTVCYGVIYLRVRGVTSIASRVLYKTFD